MGYPSRSVDHPILALDFKGLPPTKTSIRVGREDPLTVTLRAAGA